MVWQRNYVVLPTGERVRFGLLERKEDGGTAYYVRFRGPQGTRVKRSTGQSKKSAAIDAAQQVILDEYGGKEEKTERLEWDEAETKLAEAMEADGKRPATVKGYKETLRKLTGIFPSAKGPADISEKMAADFKTKYAKGREPKSLDSRIRTLKAVFTWFKNLHFVEKNPFEGVELPELDRHEVKYVREEDISQFFEWLAKEYPGWKMPALFFEVKALTGCRLEDICSLHSTQLQDGRIIFPADGTKNRSERYAVLPKDVYEELDRYKGPTWLWEGYVGELKGVIEAKGAPSHRLNPEFAPRRLYLWVVALMQEYQKDTGRELSSHDFRRAAFTRAAEASIHPKRAATAFDVTPETMMKYYTATEKKETSDDVLGGLAERLRPKKNGEGRER